MTGAMPYRGPDGITHWHAGPVALGHCMMHATSESLDERQPLATESGSLVLAMDGGISMSEDPNIRFNYRPNGATQFRVEAIDTDGHVFKSEWPIEAM